MDVLELFRQIGVFFTKFCKVSFTVGGFELTVGSVFVFFLAVSLILWFLRGLAE